MSRVLITGAGGFIGQHLSLHLLKSGWDVRGIGRSAKPPILDGVEWMTGDILDQQFADHATTGSDVIIHLACLPLGQSAQDPVQALRVNTEGTLRILEATRRSEAKRFVFISTSQVYGGHAPLPNKESNLPQPDSAYAASKLSAEMWCEAYKRAYGLPVQILRLFNVYGLAADGTPRPTVETIFLQQIKKGQRPIAHGNPEDGRDFIHVQDVVRAIQLTLNTSIWDGAINIGTGVLTTLGELALLIAAAMGKVIRPFIASSSDRPTRFQAETMLAKSRLGFLAETDLFTGLRQLAWN